MVSSQNYKPLKTLWRCFAFLRPYWRITVGAYLTLLAINGLALVMPQFVRWIVDSGIGNNDTALIAWSVLLLLLAGLIRGVLTFIQGRWSELASQGVAYDIRNAIHAKLAGLSFSYHDRTATGELLSRTIQDVDRIRFITGRALLHLLRAVILLIGTAIVLVSMNWKLGLLALCTMPILAYRSYAFGRLYRRFRGRYRS